MDVDKNESSGTATENQQVIDLLIEGGSAEARKRVPWATSWETVLERGRELGVTDRFIKECRLSGSRPAVRCCVNCDADFLSSGYHNRLCQRCRP